MTRTLSLYLDGLRFAAAFTVFLSHYAVGRISGGVFWPVADYGRTSVLVFFVLSGFVIAWVTETRERSLDDYCLARVARQYSTISATLSTRDSTDRNGATARPIPFSASRYLQCFSARAGRWKCFLALTFRFGRSTTRLGTTLYSPRCGFC